MGSSGKTRTTFAKLSRESKPRGKRADKEARKAARKFDAASAAGELPHGPEDLGTVPPDPDLPIPDGSEAGQPSGRKALALKADPLHRRPNTGRRCCRSSPTTGAATRGGCTLIASGRPDTPLQPLQHAHLVSDARCAL